MADKYAPQVKRCLRGYDFDVRDDKTRKNESGEDPGRADLGCIRGGKGVFVEIKTAKASFQFKSWKQNQRDWAVKTDRRNGSETYVWVTIGSNPPNYNPQKYKPRRSFCIPYRALLDAIEEISPYQQSIPYRLPKKGGKKIMRENGFEFVTMFAEYEVCWENGAWHIPTTHPFYSKYIG